MSQYMLLVYEEEVDPAVQAEREQQTADVRGAARSLREAGLLVGVQRLHSVESATSVRVRDGQTEITDGPFAVTKEVLAGYYILECADLDEALKQAARLPMAPLGDDRGAPGHVGRRVAERGARGRRRRCPTRRSKTWRERRRGAGRPGLRRGRARVSRRAGDRAGHPDPAGRRLPAGRGRGAGRVRGGGHGRGGATGFRPIRGRGSPPPRGGGRSIACAGTGRWPIAPSAWPS